MSIDKNEPKTKQVGVAGFLSDSTFELYRRCGTTDYLCPTNEAIGEIFRGDITTATQRHLCVAMTEHVQRFKRQSPWMSTITFATPALEVLSSEQLSAFDLELFSLNGIIAKHCVKSGIKRPALLGTEWDVAPDSPLAKTLARYGIEPQRLSQEHWRMYRLMTACVFNQMSGYINYDGTLKEANDFCTEVANRLLFETANTLDAFIICDPELRSFIPYLRSRCLKDNNAAIPIINASALHLTALAARTLENPPS